MRRLVQLLCAFLLWKVGAGGTAIEAVLAVELPATGRVEVLFTPWDDAEGALIRALDEARQTIHVQAYLLTSRNIARALKAAQARGVAVAILADKAMVVNGQNSLIPELARAGIPVWLETRYNIAHNKIMLIDGASPHGAVLTGSYNYTWSAQARNAENLLILRDDPALQQKFLEHWQRHRADAEAYRVKRDSEQDIEHGH